MKTSIREDGTLTISGSTPTEQYALRKWFEDYNGDNPEASLRIVAPSLDFSNTGMTDGIKTFDQFCKDDD